MRPGGASDGLPLGGLNADGSAEGAAIGRTFAVKLIFLATPLDEVGVGSEGRYGNSARRAAPVRPREAGHLRNMAAGAACCREQQGDDAEAAHGGPGVELTARAAVLATAAGLCRFAR